MPYRRKKKFVKRKTYRKRKFDPAKPLPVQVVSMWNDPRNSVCPDRMRVKLKWSQNIQVTNGAGAFSEYYFRMNSVFDPDGTGGGDQPIGHDQWSAFYSRYRVVRCNAKVKPVFSGAATDNAVMQIVLLPSTATTGVTDIEDSLASPYAKNLSVSAFVPQTSISINMAIATYAGVSEATLMSDDVYTAGVGADPAKQFYWVVAIQNTSVDVDDTEYNIMLTYYVEYFDRQMLNTS